MGPWWGRRGTRVWISWLTQVFVTYWCLKRFCVMISCASANVGISWEKWNFPMNPHFHLISWALICLVTFQQSPSSHVVTTPISLPILTLGITQSCVSHKDLTDKPSCGRQAPEHHALQVQGRQGPNPEQFGLCGSTGNHQLHPNDRKLQIQARCWNSSAQFNLRPVWLIQTQQQSSGWKGGG